MQHIMTEDVNIKMTVDAGQSIQATNNYKKTLKELKDEMVQLQLETNGLANATEEQRQKYMELEQQAGMITDALGDVSAQIRANADDYQYFNAALEGLKGGAAVAQGLVGTLDLLGISNDGVEKLVKTMMSLQGVMNSINAVQQIFNKDSKIRIALQKLLTTSTATQTAATGSATVAQRALNAAMNAMPILAIVSAAALLITALTKIINKNKEVADSTDEATEAQKRYNDEIKKINLSYDETLTKIDIYRDKLKNVVAGSADEAAILKEINSLFGINVSNINEANQALNEWGTGVGAAEKNLQFLNVALERAKENNEDTSSILRQQTEYQIELTKRKDEFAAKYKKVENTSKATKKAVEEEAVAWKTLKELQDAYIKDTDSGINPTIGWFKDISQTLNETNTIIANYLQGQLVDYEKYSSNWIKANQLLIQTQRDMELESLKVQYSEGQISWELFQSEKFRIEQEYVQREKDLQTEITEHQIAENQRRLDEEERLADLRIDAASRMAAGLYSLTHDLQEAELADETLTEKERLQIQKKYAIANLMINMAESGVALATSIPKTLEAYAEIPFAGPIIAAVQIAATAAAVAVQIAKIKQFQQQINTAARGAYVVGPSHREGGVNYELEGGEVVINKRAMAIPQYRALASAMNVSTGGVAFPGAGNVAPLQASMDQETVKSIVRETVAVVTAIPVVVSEESISKAQRRVSVLEGRSRI